MERVTYKEIADKVECALAKRCAASFADGLIPEGRADKSFAAAYLILNCVLSEEDLLFVLFTDPKTSVVETVRLTGDDALRTLEHPGAIVSAAKNHKASRVALCVSSVRGKADERLVLSAAEHISQQGSVRLSGFIYILDGAVRSVDCGRASRRRGNTGK